MTRIFFATDIHGSDTCWKKFVNAGQHYRADVLIMGGDITGKAIVPLVQLEHGRYKVTLMEQETILETAAEVEAMEKRVANRGYYPVRLTVDELAACNADPSLVEDLFARCVIRRLEEWLEFARRKLAGTGIRCFVSVGNDDHLSVDKVLAGADAVTFAEGKAVPLDDVHTLVSLGWTNRTPWQTYRECDEADLAARIDDVVGQVADLGRCVFNFHCPPYKSGLDDAPDLDEHLRPRHAGRSTVPVGSAAVRRAVEKYQPPLALFGHIHESRGTCRIGRTLGINPGSAYESGMLHGAVVELSRGKVERYLLTAG